MSHILAIIPQNFDATFFSWAMAMWKKAVINYCAKSYITLQIVTHTKLSKVTNTRAVSPVLLPLDAATYFVQQGHRYHEGALL